MAKKLTHKDYLTQSKLIHENHEFDEKHHFDSNGNLKEKDITRRQEIEKFLKCKFIRINESKINKMK